MVTINKAIRRAIEIKGKSLLSDSQLLILVLEDLAPELIHEREIIARYHTSEIGKVLIDIYDNSSGNKAQMYSTLVSNLTKNNPELSQAYQHYLSFFREALNCPDDNKRIDSSKPSSQTSAGTYSAAEAKHRKKMERINSEFEKQLRARGIDPNTGGHLVNNSVQKSSNSIQSQPPMQPFVENNLSSANSVASSPTSSKGMAQRSPPTVKAQPSHGRLSRKDSADLDAMLDQHNNRLLNYHKKAKVKKMIISIVIIALILAFLISFIVGLLSKQGKSTVLRGDLNGDGVVTNADLELLQDYLVDTDSIPEDKREAADYDGDGKITSHDALQMKKDLKGE